MSGRGPESSAMLRTTEQRQHLWTLCTGSINKDWNFILQINSILKRKELFICLVQHLARKCLEVSILIYRTYQIFLKCHTIHGNFKCLCKGQKWNSTKQKFLNLPFLDYLFKWKCIRFWPNFFFGNFDEPVKLFTSSSFSLPRKKVVWCKWRCSIIWKTSFARARLFEAQTSFLSNARKWKKRGTQYILGQ